MIPATSPDGRWIAYQSYESGSGEIYVASYPDLLGKKRCLPAAAMNPSGRPTGDGFSSRAEEK